MQFLKYILLFLIWPFFSAPLHAQIKPTAMLLPIYFVDLNKSSLQYALNNYAQTELSVFYDLKSEMEVEQARDEAIDELSSQNCTEEACVKVMGELLDVEYTFTLEIIDTGEGWDMTAVRLDLDGLTARRNELCRSCNFSRAREALTKILTALRPGEMLIQRGKASLRLEATPRAQVFMGGRDQGQTPLDLSVDARTAIDILMVVEGYNEFAESFNLKPGEKRRKHVNLVRKRGNIRIVSDPSGAAIFLDGKPELDSSGKTITTPADLRPVYGRHKLLLKMKKYADHTESFNINRQNHGTKKITLIPSPGRLIVRVPSENKYASVYINGESAGRMGGNISETFEVPANRLLRVEVKDGRASSRIKSISVEPDGSGLVVFDWLSTPDRAGFRYGLAYEQDFFSITLKGGDGTRISSNYSVSGFAVHGVLSPGRHLLSLKFLNGSGTITEPSPTFYLLDGDQLYTVTGTTANVFRLLYSPGWEPGWNYALGWESISFNFESMQGTQKHVRYSFLTEGGYDFSSFSDWMMQNSLSLETRLRYSLMNGLGYTLGMSWIF